MNQHHSGLTNTQRLLSSQQLAEALQNLGLQHQHRQIEVELPNYVGHLG
jgi:hypothetical protein